MSAALQGPRAAHAAVSTEGDAWIIEGVKDPINFGWNNCAGLAPEEMKGWMKFEDIRPGGYDPKARIEEMDRDSVDAEVLYPDAAAVARRSSPTRTRTITWKWCGPITTGCRNSSRTRPTGSAARR